MYYKTVTFNYQSKSTASYLPKANPDNGVILEKPANKSNKSWELMPRWGMGNMPCWLMLCLYYYSLSAMHAYKRNFIFYNIILIRHFFQFIFVIFLAYMYIVYYSSFLILHLHLGEFHPAGLKEVCWPGIELAH